MRLCRFKPNRVGVVLGDEVADVTDIVAQLMPVCWPAPMEDPLIARLAVIRGDLEQAAMTAVRLPLASLTLLSPVANPPKIVAAPVNYAKHFDEAATDPELHHGNNIHQVEKAGLFLKSPTSLIGAGETVCIRFPERRNDHEVELAVIIGRYAEHVTREDALDYVAGYAICLDMTVRGPEDRSFRKSPDTYSVLGPWLVTADEFGDPADVGLELWVGDELRQSARTRDLILDVRDLIVFATKWYSLRPGDILMTGTPEGVGPVVSGDRMRARIDGIGEMTVVVGSRGAMAA